MRKYWLKVRYLLLIKCKPAKHVKRTRKESVAPFSVSTVTYTTRINVAIDKPIKKIYFYSKYVADRDMCLDLNVTCPHTYTRTHTFTDSIFCRHKNQFNQISNLKIIEILFLSRERKQISFFHLRILYSLHLRLDLNVYLIEFYRGRKQIKIRYKKHNWKKQFYHFVVIWSDIFVEI